MVLKIDTKSKTVEIEGQVVFKELYDQLKAMFPVTFLDFKISSKWMDYNTSIYTPPTPTFTYTTSGLQASKGIDTLTQ